MAYAIEGDLERADEMLSKAIVEDPGNAEAHNNLGLVLQQLGRLEDAVACFRRALFIRPAYVIAITNLGAALAALGHHEEAIEVYTTALDYDASDVSALNNLGAALHALGRNDEAIGRFREAANIDPNFADAWFNLGNALHECEQFRQAVEAYLFALAARPNDATIYLNLGRARLSSGNFDAAVDNLVTAFNIEPIAARTHADLGRLLQQVGKIDQARASYRKAIEADPSNSAYYVMLAHITKLHHSDPAMLAMLSRAAEIDSLAEEDRINAHFALGKSLSDTNRHEEAFAHLLAGNALKRKTIDYNEKRVLRQLYNIKEVFSKTYLCKWPAAGSVSGVPIFIVGMPRSGSTLVEQILASHPQVAVAGETDSLTQALEDVHKSNIEWRYPSRKYIPSQADLEVLATSYLRRLTNAVDIFSGEGCPQRITNKMLGNFRHLGLIHRLFPQAKIIHSFRDPIQSCLSSFSINFADQAFTFDLGELGRYYRTYAILMRHWKDTLPPGSIFDVRYEAVVRDFERSARAIIDYCGLEWDDRCLEFYKAKRPVRTASVEQVRRPIYESSVSKWRLDDEALRPLLDGLGLMR